MPRLSEAGHRSSSTCRVARCSCLLHGEREPRVGLAFVAEFEGGANAILANPKVGVVFRGARRRYVLAGFPYSIVYQIKPDEIRVIAVAHQRRRPSYWAGRK